MHDNETVTSADLVGRGWALLTALIALSYYATRFPGIVAESHAKIAAVLAERAD